jgi:DNA-binding XRE family transcriptional regulator
MKTISQIKPKRKREPTAWKRLRKGFTCSAHELRERAGLTLRDVAQATGLSTATIQRMELGYECNTSNALVLAKFFETSVEKMFTPIK